MYSSWLAPYPFTWTAAPSHLDCCTGVTLVAYCGDRILSASLDEHTERLKFYKEPVVSGTRTERPGVICHSLYYMYLQYRCTETRARTHTHTRSHAHAQLHSHTYMSRYQQRCNAPFMFILKPHTLI